MTGIIIDGMHGMGDNLHQRGPIRALMKGNDVWLRSSWGSLYHDLVADGLKIIRTPIRLRTQMKNQLRESEQKYFTQQSPPRYPSFRFHYHGSTTMQTKSKTIFEAMCNVAGVRYEDADFRLPVPEDWKEPARRLIERLNTSHKPVLVYRPLTARPEWRGGEKRNADVNVYAELFSQIRNRFFVISVADLVPGREWIVGPRLIADKELHMGEFPFEHYAGLFSVADLVYTASGNGAILAPAVGTPVISVIGGYERSAWHAAGERYAPMLAIEPITPCACSISICGKTCDKRTDMAAAKARLASFTCGLGFSTDAEKRPMSEMFLPPDEPPPPNPNLMRAMYPARTRPGKSPFATQPGTPGIKA